MKKLLIVMLSALVLPVVSCGPPEAKVQADYVLVGFEESGLVISPDKDTPTFDELASEALRVYQHPGLAAECYFGFDEIEAIKRSSDFVEIGFDEAVEIPTGVHVNDLEKEVRDKHGRTVTEEGYLTAELVSALFPLTGKYRGHVIHRPDKNYAAWYCFKSSRSFGRLEKLAGALKPEELPENPSLTTEIRQLEGRWLSRPVFISGDMLAGIELNGAADTDTPHRTVSTYNLVTGVKQSILEIPDSQTTGTLSGHGNLVVWTVSREGDPTGYYSELVVLDVATDLTEKIGSNEASVRQTPHIHGETIVWLDNRDQINDPPPWEFNLYTYNLGTGRETRLTDNNSVTTGLSIGGSLVVWADNRHAGSGTKYRNTTEPDYNNEIYLHDLRTGEERRITTNPGNDYFPVTDGSRIIWLRMADWGQNDIFLYDLESGREQQITHSGRVASKPSISGDRIVWYEFHGSEENAGESATGDEEPCSDVYLYDISYDATWRLTWEDEEGNRFWGVPVIQGDYVTYSRSIIGGRTITYIMKLSYEYPKGG